ncbi:DUF3108 domain-containing protein [Eionea flava]
MMHSLSLKKLLRNVLFSAFSLNAAVLQADTPLTVFTADYKANIKGFSVNAKRELTVLEGGQYQLTFTADSWAANIEEQSLFEWKNERIKPINYRYYQTAFGKKREQTLDFSHATDDTKANTPNITINSNNDDDISQLDAPEDTLDKLSYQLQLQYDIAKNVNNLAYTIADKGRLKSYQFEILENETLDTALGKIDTVKVKVIRENPNKTTLLWFARDWHYLLTRLEQFKGDKKTLTIDIKQATVDGKTVIGHSS